MSLSPEAEAIVDALNAQLLVLIQERDRLTTLLDGSLPGDTSIWSVLPPDYQDKTRSVITDNLNSVALAIPGIIDQITQTKALPNIG